MPKDEQHGWYITENDSPGAAGINNLAIKVQFLHGIPTLDSHSGLLRYLPHPGFEGTDTATYYLVANNGQVSSPATITITVGSPANAKATKDDKAAVPEADPKSAPKDAADPSSANPEETAVEGDTNRDEPEIVASPDPDAETTHQTWLWPTVGGGVLALIAAGLLGRAAMRRRA